MREPRSETMLKEEKAHEARPKLYEREETLRQSMTLTRRTVITLEGVIKLIHAG